MHEAVLAARLLVENRTAQLLALLVVLDALQLSTIVLRALCTRLEMLVGGTSRQIGSCHHTNEREEEGDDDKTVHYTYSYVKWTNDG